MTFPHLDDEALSAAFDGEATDAEEAHLATCPQCRAELQSLAAVARAVGAPVTPPPRATVDAAIARALGDRTAGGSLPAARLAHLAPPDQGAGPQPAPRRVDRAAPGRTKFASWALSAAGVAAALVVVVGVVAVAGRFGGAHTSSSTSALTSLAPRVAAGGATSASTTISPFSASPGDLGNQTDATAVARLVAAAVRAARANDSALNPAPASTAPGQAAASVGALCVAEAHRAVGAAPANGRSDVVYTATLRWRGQPAVVVVLSRPGGLSGVILRTPDCSSLVILPL